MYLMFPESGYTLNLFETIGFIMIYFLMPIIVITAIIGIVASICENIENNKLNGPRITFKNFKDWYYLNPNAWVLHKSHVARLDDKEDFFYKATFIDCYFNLRDLRKYKNFLSRVKLEESEREKHQKKIQVNQETATLLNLIQQDINNLRKKANKEIERGASQSIDIQKRLREDIKLKC